MCVLRATDHRTWLVDRIPEYIAAAVIIADGLSIAVLGLSDNNLDTWIAWLVGSK